MTEPPPLEIRTLLGDLRPYLRLSAGGKALRMDWEQALAAGPRLAARTRVGADGQAVFEAPGGALSAFVRRAHEQMVVLAQAWREKWKVRR